MSIFSLSKVFPSMDTMLLIIISLASFDGETVKTAITSSPFLSIVNEISPGVTSQSLGNSSFTFPFILFFPPFFQHLTARLIAISFEND